MVLGTTGGAELLILAAIVLLIFGAGWLPKMARNLGKAKIEMDKAQEQFNDAKTTVVKATGVKELESTIAKANKALNTSPQQMMKNAAKSAATGGAAAKATEPDSTPASEAPASETPASQSGLGDVVEDAEIVEEHNINVNFDES